MDTYFVIDTVRDRLAGMEREYKLLKSTMRAALLVERNMATITDLQNGATFCKNEYCDGIVLAGYNYCSAKNEHNQ